MQSSTDFHKKFIIKTMNLKLFLNSTILFFFSAISCSICFCCSKFYLEGKVSDYKRQLRWITYIGRDSLMLKLELRVPILCTRVHCNQHGIKIFAPCLDNWTVGNRHTRLLCLITLIIVTFTFLNAS